MGQVRFRLKKPVVDKLCHDPVRSLLGTHLLRIQPDLGIVWRLIRIGDAGESLKCSGPGLDVESLHVSRFAHRERHCDMNQKESPDALHAGAYFLANRVLRRDRSADGDAFMTRDLRGNKSDPPDIQITMLPGEAEFRGQKLADNVAVQECNGTSGLFKQSVAERLSDSGLPSTRESGKENGHPPLWPTARKRAALVSHGDSLSRMAPYMRIVPALSLLWSTLLDST